jgi:hypothetical protein
LDSGFGETEACNFVGQENAERGELHNHHEVAVPRVFFENSALWDTAAKLATLIEHPTQGS